jgi:RsmE family RNA methyltransferase
MNLVLFEPGEIGTSLPASDPRVVHVREVLRRALGETFDAGLVDGPRGRAWLEPSGSGWRVVFEPTHPGEDRDAGMLLCGLVRPQSAKRVIRDCATLGVGEIHFFRTDRGEPSYASASLWTDGTVDALVREAAQQAFVTRLCRVRVHADLTAALADLPGGSVRLALDNYESPLPLAMAAPAPACVLAVGSERGWSRAERERLRGAGFSFHHLGPRVLRTEQACLAGLAILRLGVLQPSERLNESCQVCRTSQFRK